MKFSKNSWHYNLVYDTYGKDYFERKTLNKQTWDYDHTARNVSLCKYFWSTVLAIVIRPFLLFFRYISEIYDKKTEEKLKKVKEEPLQSRKIKKVYVSEDTAERLRRILGVGALCAVIGLLVFGIVVNWAAIVEWFQKYWTDLLMGLGIAVTIGFGIYGLIKGIQLLIANVKANVRIVKKPKEHKEPKPKEPSMVWEFIKAKKQKVCPFLQFSDE